MNKPNETKLESFPPTDSETYCKENNLNHNSPHDRFIASEMVDQTDSESEGA